MDELTVKEASFLKYYTDKDSPTYGNGTQSLIRAGYKVKNSNVAGVLANKLLRKDKVKTAMAKHMDGYKLDLEHYLKDLDKKLKAGGEDIKFSREWLVAFRTACELEGRLGPQNSVALQVNLGQPCPTCKRVYEEEPRPFLSMEEAEGKLLSMMVDTYGKEEAIRKIQESMEVFHTKDSVAFVTHAPCTGCAQKLIDFGICRVYYKDTYRCDSGINKLLEAGVEVIKL